MRAAPVWRSSSSGPWNTSRPVRITPTCEQICSTSASRCEDTNTVVEMLRRYAVELLMKGDYHIVRRGLGILGEDYVAKDPWLGLIAALAFVESS